MRLSRNCLKKKEDIPIDRESFFRNKIDSIFITASWAESVKTETGITGVSPVWDDRPEWYVWIDNAPGPFALLLEYTESFSVGREYFVSGQFSLKCYPFPHHPIFSDFSKAEQQTVLSGLFDQTNTPCMESKHRIQRNYFVVGALSFVLDSDQNLCLISFDSLDVFREAEYSGGDSANPRITRCVPGWKIGAVFFERFVSLYAFYSRQCPFKCSLSESPGFETVSSSGIGDIVPAKDLRQKSVSILFKKDECAPSAAEALWQHRAEAGDRIIMEYDGHQELKKPHPALSDFPLCGLWWHFAVMKASSSLSSICGCGDQCPKHFS